MEKVNSRLKQKIITICEKRFEFEGADTWDEYFKNASETVKANESSPVM